jgi:hypothetical protein
MSRQVPELGFGVGVVVGALTETEAPATDTLAATPVGPSVTPTPTFAGPAETFVVAATELAETDAAALTLTALPADTFAAVDTPWLALDEAPTETVATGVLTVPGVLVVVPGVPVELEGLEGLDPAEEAEVVEKAEEAEGPEVEVRATPPTLGARDAEIDVRYGEAWAAWPGWMPLSPCGDPGPRYGPCKMRTETEVSRNKAISVASPNIGSMLPAG